MRRLLSIATLLTLAAGNASATVPSSFSVQGVLRDNTGKLQSMAITVTANIFADQMGGTALNTAPFIANNVMAVNGLFTVTFSDAMLIANLSSTPSGQLWLEVTVGNDTFPRQQITPGVWALMSAQADNALQLGGKPPSSYALASQLTGGTVTSVATGTGLAGGPVTTCRNDLGGFRPGRTRGPHAHGGRLQAKRHCLRSGVELLPRRHKHHLRRLLHQQWLHHGELHLGELLVLQLRAEHGRGGRLPRLLHVARLVPPLTSTCSAIARRRLTARPSSVQRADRASARRDHTNARPRRTRRARLRAQTS